MPQVEFKLEYAVNMYEAAGATAIITAAGSSSRMGGCDKILADLAGRPILAHTLQAFDTHPSITAIVVVASQQNLLKVQQICADFPKVTDIVIGGATRAESVAAGFAQVRTRYVLIHDGARPLITKPVIDRVIDGLRTNVACAAAVPVKDTVKIVDENAIVRQTLQRDELMAMQTPQGFESQAYQNALSGNPDIHMFTDDCALVESSGVRVKCVPGDERNIKITTPTDLVIAAALLREA